MKKILCGKIGQKVLFNRCTKEAVRSNTNGNVGAYLTFKSLFENNPDCEFYFVGVSDQPVGRSKEWENVVFCREFCTDIEEADYGLFIPGITFDDGLTIMYINNLCKHWAVIADDPRCLRALAGRNDLFVPPEVIFSQRNGVTRFIETGVDVVEYYAGVEKLSAYGAKFCEFSGRPTDVLLVANASPYRNEKVAQVLEELSCDNTIKLKAFGRCDLEGLPFKEYEDIYGGEVTYLKSQHEMLYATASVIIPIEYGWATSKYVECLVNGCVPVIYGGYGESIHDFCKGLLRCNSVAELHDVLKYLNSDKELANVFAKVQYQRYVEPYADGKFFSNIVMERVNAYDVL